MLHYPVELPHALAHRAGRCRVYAQHMVHALDRPACPDRVGEEGHYSCVRLGPMRGPTLP